MSYIGVVAQYWCNGCKWNGSITQPLGHLLRILCPMCDIELEIVDADVK